MMHSIEWFWTIGLHHAAWVQAIASAVLVALTFVTLGVLCIYAWDTHRLAETSVQQIKLIKNDREITAMRNFHIAYDRILKVQMDLNAVLESLADGTFGTRSQCQVYPQNWPEITSFLMQRVSTAMQPAIKLGIELRCVDAAVKSFFNATDHSEKQNRVSHVRTALNNAGETCKRLTKILPESEKLAD